jgi:hypothetical protein
LTKGIEVEKCFILDFVPCLSMICLFAVPAWGRARRFFVFEQKNRLVSLEEVEMPEKLSKTARASLGKRGAAGNGRVCPQCGTAMVATRVIKSSLGPGGMYWVCQEDDYRVKTR